MKKVKVGFDLGQARIKWSFLNGEKIVDMEMPNRYIAKVSIPTDGTIVEFNGDKMEIGCSGGSGNLKKLKIHTSNLPHILGVVVKKIKEELKEDNIELDIVACLPPTQFKSTRDKYKTMFTELNGKKITVAGEEIVFNIGTVKAAAEGVVLLNTLDVTTLCDQRKALIWDIGASTTDIVKLEKRNDGVWVIVDADTLEAGGTKLCREIKQKIQDVLDIEVESDELERMQSYDWDGKNIPITEHADFADDYVDLVLEKIKETGNVRQYKVILGGGTSNIIKECKHFKEQVPNHAVVPAHLLTFGNSRGALLA